MAVKVGYWLTGTDQKSNYSTWHFYKESSSVQDKTA